MKKLLLVLAIGAFAACNSGESTSTEDSLNTSTTVDTNTTITAPVDTMGAGSTVDTLGTGTGAGQ
jgi:hypothetical protein